ncbi:hypothetical protein D9M68_875010 [compost metagenome]
MAASKALANMTEKFLLPTINSAASICLKGFICRRMSKTFAGQVVSAKRAIASSQIPLNSLKRCLMVSGDNPKALPNRSVDTPRSIARTIILWS